MIIPRPPDVRTSDEVTFARYLNELDEYFKNMAVDKLNQTISDPPTQTQVQDISNKLDELIGKINKSE